MLSGSACPYESTVAGALFYGPLSSILYLCSMRKLTTQELQRQSAEEFAQAEKLPLVLVLDNIRSMHNVGSAFRTADAFAIEQIVLCGITAKPPHRDIHKTALGATDTVKWTHSPDTVEALRSLKAEGYELLAIEQIDQSVSLEEFNPEPGKKYALVFGNEVFGVDDKAIAECDGAIEIPQFGTKHSLNVSISMGVVLWQLVRQLRF